MMHLRSYLSIRSMFRMQGLVKCPRECAGGTGILVLDPQSAPKWRLACNRCPAVVGLFEGASKVRVHEKQCGHCGCSYLCILYIRSFMVCRGGMLKGNFRRVASPHELCLFFSFSVAPISFLIF
uniref:DNA topoisomerase n=1 Tax=Parascaris equorum TaxID=6256 RepID=A0A914RY18_PAREQ